MREKSAIEEDLKKEEESLSIIMKTGDEVKAQAEELQKRLGHITENALFTGNRISALKAELGELKEDDTQHLGLVNWQRKTVSFMKHHPGVPIHYGAFITNLIKEKVEITAEDSTTLTGNKARTAMLSFMKTLIEHQKVERCKNGEYKWAVIPWRASAPVISIVKEAPQMSADLRWPVVQEIVQRIEESGEAGMRELDQTEPLVTKLCKGRGLAGDQEKNVENWQYVERELIKLINAPNSRFEAFSPPDGPRPTRARKDHLIRVRGEIVRGRKWDAPVASGGHDGWEPVMLPMGMKQDVTGTKRRPYKGPAAG